MSKQINSILLYLRQDEISGLQGIKIACVLIHAVANGIYAAALLTTFLVQQNGKAGGDGLYIVTNREDT